jgi:hypothetical protein
MYHSLGFPLLVLTALSLALPTLSPWQPFEPTVTTLEDAPGVVQVEVLVSPTRPTHRIIYLANCPMVSHNLFALGKRCTGGRSRCRGWPKNIRLRGQS